MKYLLPNQETARLTFRLVEASDFDTWIDLFRVDKIVATYLGFDPTLSPNALCQLWFDKVFYRYENDLGSMNVLVDKQTNALVGQAGLLIQTVEDEERLEVGYSILPKYWNKGYASEAAIHCKEYAFQHNFANSLISIIHVDNIASAKVALKNGMTIEKHIADYNGSRGHIFGVDKGKSHSLCGVNHSSKTKASQAYIAFFCSKVFN